MELQPLDKALNELFKKEMKQHFPHCYASHVKTAIEKKEDVSINLQTSVKKPMQIG